LTLPEVRLQIAAIALAEELNFTRAATRLRITQPALTKQIAELENRVGFTIFKRSHKHVELTEAGTVFIGGCKDAIALLEKSVLLARTTRDQVKPVLTIGHSPYTEPALTAAILSTHLPLYPRLQLRIDSMFAPDLAHSVLSAQLDLAVIPEPGESPNLTLVQIAKLPLYVAMAADHPAVSKASASIDDFRDTGWILFPRKAHPVIYDRILEAGRNATVSPKDLHHYVAPQEAVHLVTEKFGVAFVSKGIAEQIRNVGVVVRPLTHADLQVRNYLALRADESSRLVNDFGRAFLRKVMPSLQAENASGQLSLEL
jgi:LysR family transcriptional regulator, benzoate and cis,cis-muconate-responsive activator of ben and cat genes